MYMQIFHEKNIAWITQFMQTTRPHITYKVLLMVHTAIFKPIFKQVLIDSDSHRFYSELRRRKVSRFVYYLATDNIRIILKNDNVVLIKGLENIINVRFAKNKNLIESSSRQFKSRGVTFEQHRENLARAGVFRWVTQLDENKRDYYSFDNVLLFSEDIQTT